ncbi:MAG: M18 family aminopeptidase [Desulfobulbus propionicus]|nr:MAG: M18 family aminopeptidase [Desulfobulbus propionicus]
MPHRQFNQEFCNFLSRSTTPYHAVKNCERILEAAGYTPLYESHPWSNPAPGRYYVTRNGTSLIGFQIQDTCTSLRMAGAHTDSPTLRVKPNPLYRNNGYLQLGVEVYGGALLTPWFDRDLSMAGRVTWHNGNARLCSSLIDFRRPIALIPSLAIHLDRDANTNKTVNRQNDLVPIIMLGETEQATDFIQVLKEQLCREHAGCEQAKPVDFDLFLYDTQAPAVIGLQEEFISAARLDNLLSCYCIVQAAVQNDNTENVLFVLNDHEEVGSVSTSGAQGPFLRSILSRLYPKPAHRDRILHGSMLVSVDNAHAVHPNFATKHEPHHLPKLNGGPVIKKNANQRYASDGTTAGLFKLLCRHNAVPVQEFVMRNDMACGSTIGPLTSAAIGIPTIDIGAPQLAMHSIRETIGSLDGLYLEKILTAFFNTQADRLTCAEVS